LEHVLFFHILYILGIIIPTFIFFRGVGLNHQPGVVFSISQYEKNNHAQSAEISLSDRLRWNHVVEVPEGWEVLGAMPMY
jgi:hypothetical protein